MSFLKRAFERAANWGPLRIQNEIENKLFDDSADKKWVEDTFDYVKGHKLSFKLLSSYEGTINYLMFKAICSDAHNVIDEITKNYADCINKEAIGHFFWASATHDNVAAMEKISQRLGREHIADSDYEEALLRGAYKDESTVIDYLAKNHADKITNQAVKSAFAETACFAATGNAKKIVSLWGEAITVKDADRALERLEIQRDLYKDKFDYEACEAFLLETKRNLDVQPPLSTAQPKPNL